MLNMGLAPREAFETRISPADRAPLRELAKEVWGIRHLPIMDERRALWKRHNPVERIRPMVLVSPEGAWRDLLHAPAPMNGDYARPSITMCICTTICGSSPAGWCASR